jgi:hypothetical protein
MPRKRLKMTVKPDDTFHYMVHQQTKDYASTEILDTKEAEALLSELWFTFGLDGVKIIAISDIEFIIIY